MTIKTRIKKFVEKIADVHIYRRLPRGIDELHDIRTLLPAQRLEVIFDVGANVGQSARAYLEALPDARIYCFEPVSSTFLKLKKNLGHQANVHPFQLALGETKGRGTMVLQGQSDLFFLTTQADQSSQAKVESVVLDTIDDFCREHAISRINYLKIDTEGNDLAVLKGASAMLAAHQIDFVEVEAGMNAENKRHVPFDDLRKHLENLGYFLFGFYEQMHEWVAKEPQLRRTNPVFISRSVVRPNRT